MDATSSTRLQPACSAARFPGAPPLSVAAAIRVPADHGQRTFVRVLTVATTLTWVYDLALLGVGLR